VSFWAGDWLLAVWSTVGDRGTPDITPIEETIVNDSGWQRI
jgi:hypothetical protein